MVEKEKRLIQHNFKTTETEAEIIKKKMKSLGITNTSAFLRSMVLNGYILKLDLPQIREMIRLLSNMTNNLNQIAKRMNAHGQIYETEIDEIIQKQDELWQMINRLLTVLERTALRGGTYHDQDYTANRADPRHPDRQIAARTDRLHYVHRFLDPRFDRIPVCPLVLG